MRASTRFRSIGFVGLALGACFLYWFVKTPSRDLREPLTPQGGSERKASAASSEDEKEGISSLKEDIGRLQYQLSLLRQQASSTTERGRQSPEADRSSDQMLAEDPSEKAKQVYQERMETLESSFRSEPEDAKWSSNARSTVWELLNRDEALRVATRHLECRSSLCRMELAEDSSGALYGSMVSMARSLAKIFPRIEGNRIDGADGKATLVYYMLRTPYSPNVAER
jgi:hypothetical protein